MADDETEMSDEELDQYLKLMNETALAELNRRFPPECVEARLREILTAAGYDPDVPAATSAETKIQP